MQLQVLKQIWEGEEGHDLLEYTLLLAFVALVAAGIFVNAGQNVNAVWHKANNHNAASHPAAP